MIVEYIIETMQELDDFDTDNAWMEFGVDFIVYVRETEETFYPVFHIHENGDVDGFMGWM